MIFGIILKRIHRLKELETTYIKLLLISPENLLKHLIIYVQTVIPVKKEIYKNQIISLNQIIKNNASNSKSYSVIDLYSIFVNDSGLIIDDLSYDGVHLNEKGYDRWVKFIKPIVDQL